MSEAEGSSRKGRRLGFRRACIPCRQKKHRCDGSKPRCLGCTSRGLRCQYGPSEPTQEYVAISGVTAPQHHHGQQQQYDSGQSFNCPERYDALGQSCRVMGPGLSPIRRSFRFPSDPAPRSPVEERGRPPSDSIWSAKGSGTDSIPSPGPQTLSQPNGYFGESSSFKFVSKIRPGLHTEHSEQTPAIEAILPPVAFETPVSIAQDHFHPADGLPSKELADRLVDSYFDRVHVLYPFVHEGSFRARYEALWVDYTRDQAQPAVWLAVVNLVFAYGYEFCAEQQENFATLASPFVDRAKSIVLSHMFTSTNLHLVQALLLLCHYLQGTLQLNECWNLVGLMIRSAVSIGLHLNPAKDKSFSTVEKEERKRAWWGCFVLDRTLSMKFGRPPSILFDNAKDVDLPLDVDDQYIREASIAPRQPWGRPPRLSFFIQTIKLSEVIDNILSRMYDTTRKSQMESNQNLWWSCSPDESTRLSNAVLLDGQLQAWWDAMPVHLKTEPDLLDGREFQRQRLVIRIRFLQMRLLLQRPSFVLFCRNEMKDDFLKRIALASSQVCVSAARETIRLINDHYYKQQLNSLWYILHYVFTSLGVLLTVQTMETSLRKLLSSEEDAQALHLGMEFLRSASHNSILASRYISMLSKPNKALPPESRIENAGALSGREQGHDLQVNNIDVSATANDEAVATSTGADAGQQHALAEHEVLNELDGHFDFAQFDSAYSYDLLFGTGLPQEIVSTNWPTHESMN